MTLVFLTDCLNKLNLTEKNNGHIANLLHSRFLHTTETGKIRAATARSFTDVPPNLLLDNLGLPLDTHC